MTVIRPLMSDIGTSSRGASCMWWSAWFGWGVAVVVMALALTVGSKLKDAGLPCRTSIWLEGLGSVRVAAAVIRKGMVMILVHAGVRLAAFLLVVLIGWLCPSLLRMSSVGCCDSFVLSAALLIAFKCLWIRLAHGSCNLGWLSEIRRARIRMVLLRLCCGCFPLRLHWPWSGSA